MFRGTKSFRQRHAVDERTYSNTLGRHGRNLIDSFPLSMRNRMADQPMHVDPEFESFTYGDPTAPKAGLQRLSNPQSHSQGGTRAAS